MGNPILMYCNNNHIYDASIHDECPYCKKLRLEKENLELTVKNSERIKSRNDDDDQTVFLDGDESNETELIENKTNDDEAVICDRRVIGWLVCISKRKGYGTSLEILEGDNILCSDEAKVIVTPQICKGTRVYGRVFFHEPNRRFVFQRYPSEVCRVNGIEVKSSVYLSAYDRVSAENIEFVFVPFIGETFLWE